MKFFSTLGLVIILANGALAAPPDPVSLAKRIDGHLDLKIADAKTRVASPARDAEYLRRVYLDLTGRIPASRDVYTFLENRDTDKRTKLVEELITTPRYAGHFAAVWRAVLLPEAAANGEARVYQPGFEAWLKLRFKANQRFDQLVTELITAPIPAEGIPPLTVPSTPNPLGYFAVKEANAGNLAAATARSFLGIQIECAQCHDHPYARWSRDQFWSQAAFFAGVSRQGDDVFATLTETPGRNDVTIPNSKRTITAEFLDESKLDPSTNSRAALAAWITNPKNPYFAKATVNRLWGHFFGSGIVDPVDDFNDTNLPSHPALLDELASAFVASNFDFAFMIRAITQTKAYARTSARNHESQDEPKLFARMAVKGLTGEQLFDSLILATGYRDQPTEGRAMMRAPASPREQFLSQFALKNKPTAPETSITQALTLMNGRFLNQITKADSNGTVRVAAELPGLDLAGRIDMLYVATLSRLPTEVERTRMVTFVELNGTDHVTERLSDVLWVLLNSAEFHLNH